MKKIFAFSHIPKTAGTTLNLLLRRYFGGELLAARRRMDVENGEYRFEDFKKDKILFPRLSCISGHSLKPFVSFNEYDDQLAWFTFLRKPSSRFISHYIHQQTGKESVYHMDFKAWAKRFNRSNCMVKMIAGEENLEKAKDMLHTKFQFVGLTEAFDESIQLMSHQLNWKGFDHSSKPINLSRDNSIKQEIKENYDVYGGMIEEQNDLDDQLYDYFLKTIWAERVAVPKLETKLQSDISKKVNLFVYNVKNNVLYPTVLKLRNKF